MIALAVAVAGALGAVARYTLDHALRSRLATRVPVGTIAANLSGAFALGIVAGSVAAHGLDADLAVVAGTGFLGAFTTFSTWAYETVLLAETGARRAAALNAIGSVVAATAAAALGLALTGAL